MTTDTQGLAPGLEEAIRIIDGLTLPPHRPKSDHDADALMRAGAKSAIRERINEVLGLLCPTCKAPPEHICVREGCPNAARKAAA